MMIAKKRISMTFVSIGFLMASTQAIAQFDSGSDSSDGDFDPLGIVEIDLSLAVEAPWNSPGTGNGVYDSSLWAVVFKYGTINIQSSDVITFKNHPSGAPVVWLAEEDVMIDGTVSLDGAAGHAVGAPLPRLSEPGPGGFAGGHTGFSGAPPLESSGGFGPGGALFSGGFGGGGGYQTPGGNASLGPGGGTYGSEFVSPLIGGSGGAAPVAGNFGGGGAGGGAILIASSGNITLNGSITAKGGIGSSTISGGGSGGAIRLIADNISGTGNLQAFGGFGSNGTGNGGAGRTRVEALLNTLSNLGSPLWTESTPGPVFPPANAPTLTVASVNGIPVEDDPDGGILTTEMVINNDAMVPVVIDTTNIPVGIGTVVTVRIVPYRGPEVVVISTELTGDCTNASVTIQVPDYPHGRSELQVKANWDPQNGCP